MRRRPLAAAAAVLVLGAGAAAGCGGESSTVTKTITTDSLPTAATAPVTPTASTPTTPGATAPAIAVVGEDRLPPSDALPGLRSGSVRLVDDAQAFVDALYQSGDPAKPAAVARLEAGGYAGGALRDQLGTDPARGLTLFRSYAVVLRDDAAAQAEVATAMQEVRDTTSAPVTELDLSDIPGAQGLRVDIDQGRTTGAVVVVSFASGPYVHGLQGVSTRDAPLPEDEIVGAARDLYERVTAAP